LGSIPAAIDGCPILRVLCEGWDNQISPSNIHDSSHSGKQIHNRLATICASGLMLPVLHGQLMYVK
jgi:hypothetical protein